MSRFHISGINRIILPVCILTVLLTTTFLSLGLDSDELRKRIREESDEELMEHGRNYYRHNHMDSALMVFNYLSDGYDTSLSPSEKRLSLLAKNNVGIIYAFEYMDYKRGYEVLTDAFELADSPDMEDVQGVISINIVELLRLYGLCLQSDNVNDRIDRYLKVGVQKALASKAYKVLASLVINSFQYDLTYPVELLSAIEAPEIPDTVDGVQYARAFIKAARVYQAGDAKVAREILQRAYRALPEFSRSDIDNMGHYLTIAEIHAKEGDITTAEKIADEVAIRADSLGVLPNQLAALAFLVSLPGTDREKYSQRLLVAKDSALSKGQLQMVSEIDFRRSLNREREENKRLSLQRTRLFWGLACGTVLLLTFGILIGMLVHSRRKLKERNASLYARIQQQLATDTLSAPLPSDNSNAPVENTDSSKYVGSSLSLEKMDKIQEQLTELLANPDTVCDSELSLARIASRLNVNTSYLSRAINERFGMSFSSLLSEYRIRIATRRMRKDSPYANKTIEAIAHSVGYNSRSSFIAAFKKINGMTPSEYMKIALSCEIGSTDRPVEN